MRNVLVVIDNSYVRQDLDALLILEEDENVELTVLDEVPEDANDFDELVISTGIIDEATGLSIPVSRFSLSDKEEASYSGNIPSYGLCKDATMLYDRILRGKPKNNTDAKKTVKKPKKPQKAQPTTSVYEVEENDLEEFVPDYPPETPKNKPKRKPAQKPTIQQVKEENIIPEESKKKIPPQKQRKPAQPSYDYEEEYEEEFEEDIFDKVPEPPKRKRRRPADTSETIQKPPKRPRKSPSAESYLDEEEEEYEDIPVRKQRPSRKRKQPSSYEEPYEDEFEEIPQRKKKRRPMTPSYDYEEEYEDEYEEEFEEDFQEEPKRRKEKRPSPSRRKPSQPSYDEYEDDIEEEYEEEFEEETPKKKRSLLQKKPEPTYSPYEEEEEEEFEETPPKKRKRRFIQKEEQPSILSQKRKEKELLQNEIETELGVRKQPAKTVAVYSAKGGVGKTTIASELATVLSRMSNGRREFEVCIVDYNIDFGDVQMTLDYAPDKICLTQFAERVRSDLPAYSNPDDLVYTKNEIRSFLQRNEETGLYALIAPVTNEDSMSISSKELEIILRNLIDNGEFDFIICDTGNNTRDSTVIALDMADIVLLISTQNATTVNCNDSMLSSLASLHFDIGKMRLVINKVEKEKEVGISADDVWENTLNPYTEKPIELLAKINNHTAVKKASNYHDPLSIRDSSHPFTVQIRKIAAYVAEQESVLEDLEGQKKKKKKQKKKGFFASLFGK